MKMKNYNKKELGYREDGSVWYERYFIDGKLHRVDGPACIGYDEDGSVWQEYYYIDDKEYTNREWEAKTKTTTCEGKVVEIDGKKYKLTEI